MIQQFQYSTNDMNEMPCHDPTMQIVTVDGDTCYKEVKLIILAIL